MEAVSEIRMEMRIANFNRSYYSGMNPDTLERVPNRQAAKNNLNRLSDGLRGGRSACVCTQTLQAAAGAITTHAIG